MNRRVVIHVSALVAMLAVGAAFAPSALAGEVSWEAGATGATYEADPTAPLQEFETTAGTVKCNEVSGKVTLPEGTSMTEWTSENLAYRNKGTNECETGIEGFTPKIEMNGCNYKFHAGATVGEMANMEIEATVDIVCPEGKTIVINGGLVCKVKIGPQTGLGGVRIKTGNTSLLEDVTTKATISGIHYSHNGLCGSNGSGTNGAFRGAITETAHDITGNPKNMTVT